MDNNQIISSKVVYVNPYKETVYFSVNSDGMSIEQYFKHIVVYANIAADFYEDGGVSAELLGTLGVRESIAISRFQMWRCARLQIYRKMNWIQCIFACALTVWQNIR